MKLGLYSALLFLLNLLPVVAMAPAVKLCLEENFPDSILKAYMPDQTKKAGSLSYIPLGWPKDQWKILKLLVKEPYRKKGVATALFTQCVENIRAASGTSIIWKVSPLDPKNVPHHTLDEIYKKLIKKLDPAIVANVNFTEFEFQGFEYTTITLYLKHKQ